MLAGEISTILLLANESTTFSETEEDAAPMTTEGLLGDQRLGRGRRDGHVGGVTGVLDVVASVHASLPAALISETARPTPEISGGPR